jgi:hypothetical protein
MAGIYSLTPPEWDHSKADRMEARRQAEANFRYEEPKTLNQPPSQVYSPLNSNLEGIVK